MAAVSNLTRVRRLASVGLDVAALWFAIGTQCSNGREEHLETIRRWGKSVMKSLNVKVLCSGPTPPSDCPLLIVSNHVSLLDACTLCSVEGMLFVAMAEIAGQPVMGRIADRLGNFFHERGNIRDAARVKDRVAGALKEGWRVGVFPEGKTGCGTQLMPFYSLMAQAAIDACATMQPVAIRYLDSAGAPNSELSFGGEQTFADSLGKILGQSEIVAELTFGEPISAAHITRRDLMGCAQRFIASALGLPVCGTTADPSLLKDATRRAERMSLCAREPTQK
jgi:1-acyl-sn-glycerol-3-phosphate acyltransferase